MKYSVFRPFPLVLLLAFLSCQPVAEQESAPVRQAPFVWENANVYFLLTDRFFNGDPHNDITLGRTLETAPLRGFQGGDLKGILQKLTEGYFDSLGVNAIWFTPVVEQIHGPTDEGTGLTYGFHGYWAKDWTALDPNFGTAEDLKALVDAAHRKGIRIILDVVINHTGPVTTSDPVWPAEWVRTSPKCGFDSYANTVNCTLVDNLPDIRTESQVPAELPPFLLDKWKQEGRYEAETAELDAFFARTGYPRTPRHHIIKWLTDFIRELGVDGFRLDTAKHTEETVWSELRTEADLAFREWKDAHPEAVLDTLPFYMVGEVYGYGISGGRAYSFGDRTVDFFGQGINSLINFEFKYDAQGDYESIFVKYDSLLAGPLKGRTILNYLSSHDDGGPFDKLRQRPLEAGTKLLLCPGGVQIYYGDETSRPLDIPGTMGDATLRSFMNWEELAAGASRNGHAVRDVLSHWRKLGRFRRAHPAVGAGRHTRLSEQPYLFRREFRQEGLEDVVLVGLGLPAGSKTMPAAGTFPDGALLTDYYSGLRTRVQNGIIELDTPYDTVLLGE
ncbi:MAG: hypothetical protein RLY31_2539 [Bacteroidota bacterium]